MSNSLDQSKLHELKNVHRIVQNTFNLIADSEVKGAHASIVAEVLGWLNGFGATIDGQIKAIEGVLPKSEVKEEAKVEA